MFTLKSGRLRNQTFLTESRGPGRRLLPVLSGQRSRIRIRDCPRSQSDLNGTGLTEHPVLNGLDRASRPIAPNPPGYSALQGSPRQQPPARSEPWCTLFRLQSSIVRVVFTAHLAAEDWVPPGAIFRDENRRLMVQDVPSARSRLGGFLAEGSPQGRIRLGSEHHPGC